VAGPDAAGTVTITVPPFTENELSNGGFLSFGLTDCPVSCRNGGGGGGGGVWDPPNWTPAGALAPANVHARVGLQALTGGCETGMQQGAVEAA
jgi:hypothetical protein